MAGPCNLLPVTKTMTDDKALLKNFTLVLETYGNTALGGDHPGQTEFSFLPGVRWEIGRNWWFAASLEVPVTQQRESEETWRFGLIKDLD